MIFIFLHSRDKILHHGHVIGVPRQLGQNLTDPSDDLGRAEFETAARGRGFHLELT
jgi:hypothetical protein